MNSKNCLIFLTFVMMAFTKTCVDGSVDERGQSQSTQLLSHLDEYGPIGKFLHDMLLHPNYFGRLTKKTGAVINKELGEPLKQEIVDEVLKSLRSDFFKNKFYRIYEIVKYIEAKETGLKLYEAFEMIADVFHNEGTYEEFTQKIFNTKK